MKSLELTSVGILIFCSFVKGKVKVQQDTCLPFPDDPACGCTLKDGKTIDLRNVGSQDGHPVFNKVQVRGQYYVSYNPCYPFNTSTGCTNAAVCLEEYFVKGYTIGLQETAKFEVTNNTIIIKYDGGEVADHMSSQVILKCDSGASKFSFDFPEFKDVTELIFTLSTPCACLGLFNNLTAYDVSATCSKTSPTPYNSKNTSKCKLYIIIAAVVVGSGVVLGVITIVVVCYLRYRYGHRCGYKKIDGSQHKTIKDVYEDFRVQLIVSLPMDDTIFSALLRAQNLLPGDLKEEVQRMPTRARKAELFLDRAIEIPLRIDNCEPFNNLLAVMSDEGHNNNDSLKKLATTIKQALAKIA